MNNTSRLVSLLFANNVEKNNWRSPGLSITIVRVELISQNFVITFISVSNIRVQLVIYSHMGNCIFVLWKRVIVPFSISYCKSYAYREVEYTNKLRIRIEVGKYYHANVLVEFIKVLNISKGLIRGFIPFRIFYVLFYYRLYHSYIIHLGCN